MDPLLALAHTHTDTLRARLLGVGPPAPQLLRLSTLAKVGLARVVLGTQAAPVPSFPGACTRASLLGYCPAQLHLPTVPASRSQQQPLLVASLRLSTLFLFFSSSPSITSSTTAVLHRNSGVGIRAVSSLFSSRRLPCFFPSSLSFLSVALCAPAFRKLLSNPVVLVAVSLLLIVRPIFRLDFHHRQCLSMLRDSKRNPSCPWSRLVVSPCERPSS